MSTALPPIPPNIAQLTGPLALGHFFNWSLFGALTVQAYIYYIAFPNDKRLPKYLVLFVYSWELLQTVLATRDAFRNFGTGWGNMIDLNNVGWLWFSVPVMSAIISCTVQLFFAWRVRILSHQIWIPAVITLLSLVQAGAGIYSGVLAHELGIFSEVQVHGSKGTSVWLGGTALCDVIIAISMIYYLLRARTGFRSTNTLLAKFIRITIETGLVCATFAILDLTLFLRFQNNNYHLAPSIALSKLYSNSLLVVLNARVRISGGRNGEHVEDATLSYMSRTANSTSIPYVHKLQVPKFTVPNGKINVNVSREVNHDTNISMVDSVKFDPGSLSQTSRSESYADGRKDAGFEV